MTWYGKKNAIEAFLNAIATHSLPALSGNPVILTA
jgi:hypothetical protein